MLWTLIRAHLRPYGGAVAAIVVLQLVSTITTLYLPSLNGRIIDDGIAQGETGTIVRLGTKLNAAGASQFPDVGQASIASRVGATAGMTSYFTIWYRNSAAYCTPATFNDTNGWRMTWTP